MGVFEGADHRGEAGCTLAGIVPEAGVENGNKRSRDMRRELSPDRLLQNAPILRLQPARGCRGAGWLKGQHPMREHTERVDVCGHIGILAAQQLRCAVPGVRARSRIRETPDRGGVVGANRDGTGVDISVDDAQTMCVLQCARNLRQPAQSRRDREFFAAFESCRQGFGAQGLLDSTGRRAVDSEVENPGDRGVFQPSDGCGPLQEQGLSFGVLRDPGVDDDGAFVPRVATEIGGCSSLRFEAAENLKVTNSLTHARMPRS